MTNETAEQLREEIIKEWFKDMQGKSFETRMGLAINKVLDAAVKEMKIDAKELGVDEGAIHYLQTGIKRLKGEK